MSFGMLFVEAGALFQELVSKVLPKSKVDLFYGTDCFSYYSHIFSRTFALLHKCDKSV